MDVWVDKIALKHLSFTALSHMEPKRNHTTTRRWNVVEERYNACAVIPGLIKQYDDLHCNAIRTGAYIPSNLDGPAELLQAIYFARQLNYFYLPFISHADIHGALIL